LGKRKMQKTNASLILASPKCKKTFEFDLIGEYQYVPCPICGTELKTTRKDQTLFLELSELDKGAIEIQNQVVRLVELRLR
jgi:hypothetical protein